MPARSIRKNQCGAGNPQVRPLHCQLECPVPGKWPQLRAQPVGCFYGDTLTLRPACRVFASQVVSHDLGTFRVQEGI